MKTATTKSPVQEFGDLSFQSEPIGNFEGNLSHDRVSYVNSWKGWMKHKATDFAFNFMPAIKPEKPGTIIDVRDIDLAYLTEQASKNDVSQEDLEALGKEIEHRAFVDGLFG